jgi:hypothetical protein
MSLHELIERLHWRVEDAMHASKISVRTFTRFILLALVAAFVTTIAPTLADELASDPSIIEPVAEPSPTTITETIAPSPSESSPSQTPVATPVATPEPSESTSASPSPSEDPKVAAMKVQPNYVLRIPATSAVDPRATTFFLPSIYISVKGAQPQFTMACIVGSGVNIDIGVKRSIDNTEGQSLSINGDRTNLIQVVGSTAQVASVINSEGGLFAFSGSKSLSGSSAFISLVGVTKPQIDPQLCSRSTTAASTTLRAIGLELSTVKGQGNLK